MYRQAGTLVSLVAIAAVMALSFAVGALAADHVPQIVNYQARLRNADGSPVANGTYSIVFTIYDSATGGNSLWTETQGSVQVTGDMFHALLGSVNAIAASVFPAGADRWIGITVGTDAELSPRQKIASVPFALRADTVSPSSVGSTEIADNAVVAAKIAGGAVGATALASGAVTSDKIATGAVGATALASGAVGSAALASGAVTTDKLAAGIATPPGMVQAYAGSSAPTGWLLCAGSAVSRTTYAALFAVIGTTYGAGDGSTTFNLPDLRGRVPVGVDGGAGRVTSNNALGQSSGEQSHTLSAAEMPAHTHGPGNLSTDGAHWDTDDSVYTIGGSNNFKYMG